MKKALLLSFIFLAVVLSSAYAQFEDTYTENTTGWSITPTAFPIITSTDHKVGNYSIEFRVATGFKTVKLNFTNASGSPIDTTGNDIISFWMKRTAKSGNFWSWTFYTDASNYYEYTNPPFNLTTGSWLVNSFNKTYFNSTGSPDWANISYMEIGQSGNSPFHRYLIDGFGFYTQTPLANTNITGTNFVLHSNKSNTSELDIYWMLTEQPVQIQGDFNGTHTYVGFFPIQFDGTYYAPFENGSFVFHCNPDNIELDGSSICTGTLVDDNGTAVTGARIEWELFNFVGTSFDSGDFIEVGNGVYKFRVDLTQAQNYTEGDYYFIFSSVGFAGGVDFTFPVFVSLTYATENLVVIFTLVMIVLAVLSVIFGYWKKIQSFVIFGAFTMILIAMIMLEEMTLFGQLVANVFAVIFALIGFFLLLQMFLEKWQEKVKEKKERERIF